MLVAAHVGYTVGALWQAQKRILRRPIDFRLIALMALLPDLIDRALYIFVLRDARRGRLIAHTLTFNIALVAALVAIRRRFWVYGLASLGHLLLDAEGLPPSHAFWPALGMSLAHVGIMRGDSEEHYGRRVQQRLRKVGSTYGHGSRRAYLLDAGGVLSLVSFALREQLYRPSSLRRLLASGHLEAAA